MTDGPYCPKCGGIHIGVDAVNGLDECPPRSKIAISGALGLAVLGAGFALVLIAAGWQVALGAALIAVGCVEWKGQHLPR